MAINIPRGATDPIVDQIVTALKSYEVDHPASQIDLYRYNPVSVRVRIIDPHFKKFDKVDQYEIVWRYLNELSEETQSDISTLILLAPDETKKSYSNLEFEDPLPSIL